MTFKETLNSLIGYAEGMRVLYVEDDLLIRENTQMLLSNIFSAVHTAANGKEGLDLYQKGSYELVITDILMPDMNGIRMIENILRIHPSQAIIVTSACEEGIYLEELIQLGVSEFILKPMKTEQMITLLYNVVETIYHRKSTDSKNAQL